MEHIVTARKWRPIRFDEVIGQEHITQTLKNAVSFNRIHHAYLFTGPRGVGKTTTARILARAVNCENQTDAEPCNKCESCTSILEGRSLDVIEIDGASNNSVDDIRTLRENAKYPPIKGRFKIYIIDEVHMLSTSAFNALLKILEEPPKHLIFIFATTEPFKVLPTIVSRCQRFDFHRMEINTIVKQISKIANAENIEIDEMSLFTIAKKADGSMRDAQSIFDQFVTSSGKKIHFENVKELLHIIDLDFFFKVSTAYHQRNPRLAFEISEDLTKNGYDYGEFITGLLEHFRNIYYVKILQNAENLDFPKIYKKKYMDEAGKFNTKDLVRVMNLIASFEQQFKFSTMPRIRLELLLTQIIEMPSVVDIEELIKEIRKLRLCSQDFSQNQFLTEKETEKPTKRINTELKALFPKWSEFLDKYNSTLNGLKSFYLSHLVEVEFRQKEIILIAGNDFVYENLKSKKRAIGVAIKEFFGNDFEFQLIQSEKILENQNADTLIEDTSLRTNVQNQSLNQNQSNSVEKAILDLFKAREIPLP